MKKILTLLLSSALVAMQMPAFGDCGANFYFSTDGPTVHFTNASTGGGADIVSYQWTFDDGSNSDAVNPVHTYDVPGTYHVCLVIMTDSGCTSDHCEWITVSDTVDGGCHAGFTFTTDAMTVHFTDTSTGADTFSYTWDFGDGTFGDGADPSHTYAAEGTYIVCLTVNTPAGCTDTYCDDVHITGGGAGCSGSFDFTTDGMTVHFTSSTSPGPGDVDSYVWDFGDGEYGDGADPSHTYTEAGTYTICLTVFFYDSCSATFCDSVFVSAGGGGCSDSFTFIPDGMTVHFTSSTSPGPGDVDSYVWDFGDGDYGDGADPSHTYTEAGTYTVCLTVVFYDSCTATYCHTVEVGGGGGCSDSFTFSTDGMTVHFTSSTSPGPGDVDSYVWDFGDGEYGDGADPSHTYTEAGTYTICLTVFFYDSCSATFCDSVFVSAGGGDCISDFVFDGDGLTVHFYETATGDVTSYAWTFGDGTGSDDPNPTHIYGAAGTYTVCLTITTAVGCVDTYCTVITVGGAGGDCESAFEFTVDGSTVSFFETAYGGGSDILYYFWDFGDGTTGSGADPVHVYATDGTYTACLTIFTADSCTSTECHSITISTGGGGTDCHADFTVTSIDLTPDGWVVNFNNESTADGGVGTVLWYFGDGSTGGTYDATHTYTEAGVYLVCVVITSADGSCIDIHCENITIGGAGGDCASSFTWDATGTDVAFTETATGGGSDIVAWLWSFGDGSYSTEANPDHAYLGTATYNVCLTIVTADSCISTHCEEIHVEGEPGCHAYFEISDITETGDGWVVHFDNGSTGTSDLYAWTFGDGGTSDAENPEHLYTADGTYVVCLTLGALGTDCYDTYCIEFTLGGSDSCIDESVIDAEHDCDMVYDPVCGCDGNTYENGCVAYYFHGVLFWTEGACTTAISGATGILGGLQIFPNPANEVANIRYTVEKTADIRITMTDMTGRSVTVLAPRTTVPGTYTFQLQTGDFAAGIYLVQISSGDATVSDKLIITR